jgi:hypothetical protein
MKPQPTLGQKTKAVILLAAALPVSLLASPTTLSQKVEADTYVSSGQPDVNFGSMGAMMIAVPTASQNRTEESLIRFKTASLKSSFDVDYGPGNWTITSVTLSLFSNFSTAGQQPNNTSFNKIAAGDFELDWLSNDSWGETAITWNTLSTVLPGAGNNALTSLGSFYWEAGGRTSQTWTLNLAPDLIGDVISGSEVTIFGQPTSGSAVGYLFNTLNNNPAYLNVTADAITPAPEPETGSMILAGAGAAFLWLLWRSRFAKKR